MNKIYVFDYILSLFEKWYNGKNKEQNREFKNCSKLSMLKLLFLIAVPKGEDTGDLLDAFDNFCALPYGPVESDMYNTIQKDNLPSYVLTERSVTKKRDITSPYNENGYLPAKNAVYASKEKNRLLILLNAFDLVETIHKWGSWKQSINFAELMDMSSYKVIIESIRSDRNKCFE